MTRILPVQCRVRVATHNANVDAVVGYYKDVLVKVGLGGVGGTGCD